MPALAERRALLDETRDAGQPRAAKPGGAAPDGRWEQRAPALPVNVAVLRTAVVAFAAQHDADTAQQGDIALAVSEAVANAVMHGFVDASPGSLHVIAEHHAGQLVVRVIDDGSGMKARPDSPGAGLGTPLMAALSAELRIAAGPHGTGTETRLTFELQAGREAKVRVNAAAPKADVNARSRA